MHFGLVFARNQALILGCVSLRRNQDFKGGCRCVKRDGQPIVPYGQRQQGRKRKLNKEQVLFKLTAKQLRLMGEAEELRSQLREKNKEMKENSSLMEELLKPEVEVDDETMFLWWLELWAVVS